MPTWHELACAPELAILASIETTLDVALVALVAAQPELWPSADHRDAIASTTAEAADRVISCAQNLAAAIVDYRAALRDDRHDLPF